MFKRRQAISFPGLSFIEVIGERQFEKELLLDQRRIARDEIEKHRFDSDRWKKAKDQLIAETGGKYAYCEAPTTVVAYGDVEHYRPKSAYWWLAYCYDNLSVFHILMGTRRRRGE